MIDDKDKILETLEQYLRENHYDMIITDTYFLNADGIQRK